MKIKLLLNNDKYDLISKQLSSLGIEIDDDAEFILMERNSFISHLSLKDNDGHKINIHIDDIIFIESYSHDIDVHTVDGCYKSTERLYQLCNILDPQKFLRISNSVIIARNHVKKIRPALSMKFVLTMSDGTLVDVTRSYYNIFKDFFNI